MSQPQPPYGPQDPNQPPVDPFPTAPVPHQQYPADPTAPLPPVSGAPQYPTAPQPPYAPLDPTAVQPPTSGAPYPPVSGAPQPPVSGSPYPQYDPNASMPPVSGAPYPPVSGGGYPPVSGPGYPPAPGQPLGPPMQSGAKKKPWVIIGIIVAVLLLLCCGGGIAALVAGGKKAADKAEELERSLPTPRTTAAPAFPGTKPSASASAADGETFNMEPGDTLVIEDDEGTIEITIRKFSTSTKGCRSYAPAPDKGLYLIADVTATVTKGKASINPFYFQWVAEDGTTVNGLAGALSGCGGDMLDSGSGIRAGSKRSGAVVFDVKDKNGVVEYRHKFEAAGSWKP
ncbi:hypothetical protein AB0F73_15240 [Micromonospora purpureochromogenes]|uniref:hypothetical protein n=1 Tax=Micromonospora purpureochromogenes TaxID=47872 RepID=UPI00340996D3